MSKKQKHKQKKKEAGEIIVSMSLPQHADKSNEELYELFKARVLKKSQENMAEHAVDPTQLILAFPLAKINVQMGVVVERGSFMQFPEEGKEKGFIATVFTVFGRYNLYVYKRGKALLEPAGFFLFS